VLCDKAKEILMEESNVQVSFFIYSIVLSPYLYYEFTFLTRVLIFKNKRCKSAGEDS
jgi:hypothetical protein